MKSFVHKNGALVSDGNDLTDSRASPTLHVVSTTSNPCTLSCSHGM